MMAASVLNSQQAIGVSIFIVRTFVKLREFVATKKGLANKSAELERKFSVHDETILSLIAAIRKLKPQLKNHVL